MTCTGKCAYVTGVFFCIFLLASKHGVWAEWKWKGGRSILCIILQASSWSSIIAIMDKWYAGWKEGCWLSKAQFGHSLARPGWVHSVEIPNEEIYSVFSTWSVLLSNFE